MKTFICFVLLIISISYVNAQETAIEQNNTRVSVYLHPVSSYFVMADLGPMYLTVEIPFSLSNSLIIRPSFLNISHYGGKAFRLGSDIGFRHYLVGNGEGLYLQGQMGVFYFRHNNYDSSSDNVFPEPFYYIDIPRKSLWLDAMGYIGYSVKFSRISIFIDAGLGAIMGINHPWPDINIGIGIPFGAAEPINTPVSTQEEWELKQDNTRISIYLHPFFFLLGILETDNPALIIYSTIEIPFNLKRSLIVKPSLLRTEKDEFTEQPRELRVGGDIGMRTYYDKKGEGFYWQMQMGAFYHDAHHLFPEISANNSIWFDIMGYSGYSWKFSHMSIFTDIGAGLMSLFALEHNDRRFGFSPVIDANIGIGIPF